MDDKSWPPAPAEQAQAVAVAAVPGKPFWKHYGFVCAAASNVAAGLSSVHFFLLPRGSGVYTDDWLFFFIMPLSFVTALIGVPLCLWNIQQRERGEGILWEMIGIVLSVCPFPLALSLLNAAFTLRRLWDDG